MTARCELCSRILDDPADPLSVDCGGDCLGCMHEIETWMAERHREVIIVSPENVQTFEEIDLDEFFPDDAAQAITDAAQTIAKGFGL